MSRWRQRGLPKLMKLSESEDSVDTTTDDDTLVKELGPLVVEEKISVCGQVLRKCPFCHWHCTESKDVLTLHVHLTHVNFSELFRTWDSPATSIPRHVILGWRLDARAITNTNKLLNLVVIKTWVRSFGYFIFYCPLCGSSASKSEEIKQHLLAHVQFQSMPCSTRLFSDLSYDPLT
jgi:hypothetical protein